MIGFKSPTSEKIGLRTLEPADVEGLRVLIEHQRAKAERVLGREVRVLCCYEAAQHQPSVHQRLSGHLRSAHFPSAQPAKARVIRTGGLHWMLTQLLSHLLLKRAPDCPPYWR